MSVKVIKTYKYQLRPSKEKNALFFQVLGVCRLMYNECLDYKVMLYKEHQKTIGRTQLQKEVKEVASEYDWVKVVDSQVRQNVVHRLLRTYDNFFKRGAGFPKFAKKGQYNSFTFPQRVSLKCNYIRLPKIGWIKYYKNQKLPSDAVIKTTTVIREADAWHASITFETDHKSNLSFDENQSVGIDLGVKYYYVTSNGEFMENPSFLKQFARRIKILNRKLARQKKGSKSRDKTKVILQKTYLKLKRKRRDFIHKLTANIVRNNSIIIVEKLKIKNMTKSAKGNAEKHGKNVRQKSGLNRVLLDLGGHEFYRQLEYKSNWNNRVYIEVNPAYTSQECSKCGHTSKNNRLSQSKFKCEECGHEQNADLNASNNIEGRGIALYRQREALACA